MRTLLVVFICIILGFVVQQAVLELGLMLPLFVPCLLVGLVVGNLLSLVPFVRPVSHTAALSLVSEFALGVFLAVSLMALQLWALAGMAGTLLIVLAVQTAIASPSRSCSPSACSAATTRRRCSPPATRASSSARRRPPSPP